MVCVLSTHSAYPQIIRSFPVTLENPHVVDGQQAWVGVAKVGPDNVPLNSSYAQRLANSCE